MIKWVLGIWILSAGVAWGQGYAIRDNQVAVDRQEHWANWNFAAGTVEVAADGTIQPHFVRKDIDAVEDIVFQMKRHPPAGMKAESITIADAVEAGSRAADVPKLLDGDESTYWEPEADRPLRDWWFQVDLGRLVSARQIVLKFVPEGEGDPFLQFSVLTSDGQLASKKTGAKRYNRVFQTLKANKNQRVFDIELNPAYKNVDGRMVGDQIRFVQVVVTGSDSLRAAEVSAEEYKGLAPGDQGEIKYYKRLADGEIKVSQATYEAMDPLLRGSVRYYRREHPRLAELEVWTVGENISLGLEERKGVALNYYDAPVTAFFDGQYETTATLASVPEKRSLFFDLGAMYWIDTYQVYYSIERSRFASYDLQTSDGSLAADGSLLWTTQAALRDRPSTGASTGDVYDVDHFPSTRIRFVRILFWGGHAGAQQKPLEIQFYGEGYQPEVEMTSPLIRLGAPKNLISVEWDAETPPGTFVEVQTRTGDQLAEEFHYFNKAGSEVTADAYQKLGFFQRGRIDTLEVPGADWSNWSLPYADSGVSIASPSPRQYLVIRTRLLASDPFSGASLRDVRVNFVSPIARQIQGEIEPGRVTKLGVEQEVSLFIKPTGQDLDFDEIRLRAPSSMKLEFRQLRLGRETQWESGEIEGADPAEVQVIPTGTDSLWLRLTHPVEPGGIELAEVRFTTALFAPGAALQVELGNSSEPNSWQQVDGGDATELAASQDMVLAGPIGVKRILSEVELSSPVVTPNGDGINDQISVAFSVHQLTGPEAVQMRIYDLAGRLVRQWQERRSQVSGTYAMTWAGDDQDGKMVPPGIYLLEIGVEVDSGAEVEHTVVQRLLQVAY